MTVALVVVLGTHATARAESLGAWTYTAPAGFQVAKNETQHEYTRVDGKTFCKLAVYTPRAEGASLDADVKKEWTDVVESSFKTSGATTLTTTATKLGLKLHTVAASFAKDNGTFYGQLTVIRERATVGSVLVLSSSKQTIRACLPAVTALTASIAFAAAPTPTPTPMTASSSLVGQWGLDTPFKQHNSDNWMVGYVRAQYDFRADGTYAFRKELKFEGSPKTTFDNYVESGTYSSDGASLTIAPKTSKHVKRDIDGKVLKSDSVALEKVTYAFRTEHVPDNKETMLVIKPAKETTRDGTPNGGSYAPGSYILTNPKTMYWKY
jgi:hypothetical protein